MVTILFFNVMVICTSQRFASRILVFLCFSTGISRLFEEDECRFRNLQSYVFVHPCGSFFNVFVVPNCIQTLSTSFQLTSNSARESVKGCSMLNNLRWSPP